MTGPTPNTNRAELAAEMERLDESAQRAMEQGRGAEAARLWELMETKRAERADLEPDATQAMATIWDALHAYRADLIPEGDSNYDSQWDSICEAMATIEESLS